MSSDGDGLWIDDKALEAAPYYEHSYLIFYNGNLHNYYHWIVEVAPFLGHLMAGARESL